MFPCSITLHPSSGGTRLLCFHNHLRPPFIPPCCHTLCRTLLGCPEQNTDAATSPYNTSKFSLCLKIKQTHLGLFGGTLSSPFSNISKEWELCFRHMACSIKLPPISLTLPFFLLQFCQVFPIPRNRNSERGGGCRFLAQEVGQMLFLKEDDHDCLCE